MFYSGQITGIQENQNGTKVTLQINKKDIKEEIIRYRNKGLLGAELRVDDNRSPSAEQRAKFYATIGDVWEHTGVPEKDIEDHIKYLFSIENDLENVSMSKSKGNMTIARKLITRLIEFCFEWDIPLTDLGLNRTDDINRYLYASLKHKKCCICGNPSEVHHWDAIGMGRNRKKVDDSSNRKIALCRIHHTEVETIGRDSFESKYHVYGIKYNE